MGGGVPYSVQKKEIKENLPKGERVDRIGGGFKKRRKKKEKLMKKKSQLVVVLAMVNMCMFR